MAMIDGPRLMPANNAKPKRLVVFLHGYGADGNDLIDIGRHWQRALPDAAFVSPHAPEPCGMSPMGKQWFPLTMRDPSEYWRGCVAARPVLDAFLDAELARHGLMDADMALVGFSQGTMMALHAGLRRRAAPAAVLGFSGLLAGPEHLGETTARPRLLLIHGDRDEVIPVGLLFAATGALSEAGIPVTWHIAPGLGHGIDPEGLTMGARFLANAFAGR
jgi:phospholipase/carboxylesterase